MNTKCKAIEETQMSDIVTTYVETFEKEGVEAAEAYLAEQGDAVTDEVKEAIKAAMAPTPECEAPVEA